MIKERIAKTGLCVAVFSVVLSMVVGQGGVAGARYYADRLLVCFRAEVGKLHPRVEGGVIVTGLSSFDRLAKEYGVCRLERWLTSAREGDHDGDIYLAQIYRATFTREDVEVEEVVQAFSEDDHLVFAEPEAILQLCYTPNDPRYNRQWHLPQIRADLAWDLWIDRGETPGDTTIVIGIVDSGTEWVHPDLTGNIWQNLREDVDGDDRTIEWVDSVWVLDPGDLNGVDDDDWDGDPATFVDDLIGWDFGGTTSGNDPDNDPRGGPNPGPDGGHMHGTHTGGTAAAVTDNDIGVASVGWRVKIMPVKCQYDNNENDLEVINGYDGLLYAAQAGADIINCSWGGYSGASRCATVNVATETYGAIVVGAAGNESSSDPLYPAACEEAISVAATAAGDYKAGFSNYGTTIDVAAPGEGIWSTVYSYVGGGYQSWAGTSESSPMVAGALGLLKSMFPDSSNAWLRSELVEHCDSIDHLNPAYAGKLGAGRINIYASIANNLYPQLTAVTYTAQEVVGNDDGVLNPGERAKIRVTLRNGRGWLTAREVTATLRVDSELIQVTDSAGTYPDIVGGAIGLNLVDRFEVDVAEEIGVEYWIPAELVVRANEGGERPYEAVLSLLLYIAPGDVVEEVGGAALPEDWWLAQNYPNPFNPNTDIVYALPCGDRVRLEIYDLLGRPVVTLVDDEQAAGVHRVAWEAEGVASGLYFLRLWAGEFTAVRKMVLVR